MSWMSVIIPLDDSLQSLGTWAKCVPVWPTTDYYGSTQIFISQNMECSDSVYPNYVQVFCRPGFCVLSRDTFSGSQKMRFRKGLSLFRVAKQLTRQVKMASWPWSNIRKRRLWPFCLWIQSLYVAFVLHLLLLIGPHIAQASLELVI